MAQFSNHLKILLTEPTTRIQETKLVERPRHERRSVRKREVGVVQASQLHFITSFFNIVKYAKAKSVKSNGKGLKMG